MSYINKSDLFISLRTSTNTSEQNIHKHSYINKHFFWRLIKEKHNSCSPQKKHVSPSPLLWVSADPSKLDCLPSFCSQEYISYVETRALKKCPSISNQEARYILMNCQKLIVYEFRLWCGSLIFRDLFFPFISLLWGYIPGFETERQALQL